MVRFGIGMTKRYYPEWRPKHNEDDLLYLGQQIPKMREGYPQFDEQWDLLNVKAKGQRSFQSAKDAPKLNKDWTIDQCHEMKGKFRFYLTGDFYDTEGCEAEVGDW